MIMKRYLILFAALSALLLSLPQAARGQKSVWLGVRVGATASGIISNTPTGNWVSREQTPNWGYTAGVMAEFRIVRMFSIQPELLVTLKGSRSQGDVIIQRSADLSVSSTAYERQMQNLTYLELPIRFVLKIPIKQNALNIAAGPYVAYGVRGIQRSSFTRNGANIDREMTARSLGTELFRGDDRLYRPWDFSLTAMVGWEFDFGLFLDAGYSVGLITMDVNRRYRDLNSSMSLSVGVKF
jgi:hypothetical protein